MPIYLYSCRYGHTNQQRRGLDDNSISCPDCGEMAFRHEVYTDQYTRTESGGMQGRMGKSGTISEDAERFGRNSLTIKKETGADSGLGLR